jgi:aspartyl-tRNA(Asn)/glutamyl-tRNA(Gln) amidotransferase subunit C
LSGGKKWLVILEKRSRKSAGEAKKPLINDSIKRMSLSSEEVRHVATLARLALGPDEERKYGSQLSAILEHISQLGELDTSSVPSTSHALKLSNVSREDAAIQPFDPAVWSSNAPSADHGHFRVPKVLD